MSGFLRGPESGYTVAMPMAGALEGVTFTGDLLGRSVEGGVLTLELAGEGILEITGGTDVLEELEAGPGDFRLAPNYPNPFNSRTVIPFRLADHGPARMTVFNSLGARVRTLVDGELPPGVHQAAWDGRDEAGEAAATGVYVVELRSGSGTAIAAAAAAEVARAIASAIMGTYFPGHSGESGSRVRVLKEGAGGGPAVAQAAGAMPEPGEGERPALYADRVGEWYAAQRSERHRKRHGLFLTPVCVADFMAARLMSKGARLRVLDPAAGAGVLCCAAVEALASRRDRPEVVELVAYEVDPGLARALRAVLEHLGNWCLQAHGVVLSFRIEARDFILENAGALDGCGFLHGRLEGEDFDMAIANPPYFKISRSDPRATAVPDVVHGQPNIYALFFAVSAALLRGQGDLVFITPRSFASGPYFRRFRTLFFDMIRPVRIHVLNSRRDAFRRDAVLQENVILSGIREDRWHRNGAGAALSISSSNGIGDIADCNCREVPIGAALQFDTVDKVLRVPTCDGDDEVLAMVDYLAGQPRRPRAEHLHRTGSALSRQGAPFRRRHRSREPRASALDESRSGHASHMAP